MGKGGAVLPTGEEIVAPFDGEITLLFATKHAIGLTDENGVELLIHVGLDTVELNGEHMTSHIEQGDQVKAGDVLITFDKGAIEEAGYSLVTPVIVTNTNDFKQIASEKSRHVETGDQIATIVK